MTPVILLTGFLGSGKTTLLSRLLNSENFKDTAVIVNEFGSVSLDHEMVRHADESIITLGNGCLCCRSQSDIAIALNDLRRRRAESEISFQRVVIETSGLADPVPLLKALGTDLVAAMDFELAGVVTVVDAVAGLRTLDQYEEARRQVAMADQLLLSKTDLTSDTQGILARLASLNSSASVSMASQWDGVYPRGSSVFRQELAGQSVLHSQEFGTVSIIRETPLLAVTIPLFLEGLSSQLGERLLRVKGLICLEESPDRPMVVHTVQNMVHVPQWMDAWPSADRRSRIVLIGHHLPQSWPGLLLDVLDAEARSVAAHATVQSR